MKAKQYCYQSWVALVSEIRADSSEDISHGNLNITTSCQRCACYTILGPVQALETLLMVRSPRNSYTAAAFVFYTYDTPAEKNKYNGHVKVSG